MNNENKKLSGFVVSFIGGMIFLSGIALAFLLGVEYRVIYVPISFVGFFIYFVGSIKHADHVFKKFTKKSKNNKQPWE